jgi:hypothetical protein
MIPVGFNMFGLKILAVVTAILLNPLFVSTGSATGSQQKESVSVQDQTKDVRNIQSRSGRQNPES